MGERREVGLLVFIYDLKTHADSIKYLINIVMLILSAIFFVLHIWKFTKTIDSCVI